MEDIRDGLLKLGAHKIMGAAALLIQAIGIIKRISNSILQSDFVMLMRIEYAFLSHFICRLYYGLCSKCHCINYRNPKLKKKIISAPEIDIVNKTYYTYSIVTYYKYN